MLPGAKLFPPFASSTENDIVVPELIAAVVGAEIFRVVVLFDELYDADETVVPECRDAFERVQDQSAQAF
ncbi:hypothetical protein AA0229_0015 [Gluconobacter cerinus NRIC 0229]|uniref:Uncharacterized protein n=1 Tax=Gluconobacter cerinus TaxID=38307 RepID=A0AAV5NIT3_9PROT|nr:hypothetical protein AA0229_0015 [Gluconobacter cerinus NRIC 0229]GLQ64289.1 hypothetical protein GCM10007867_31360 [Gluconobacter cerinus]